MFLSRLRTRLCVAAVLCGLPLPGRAAAQEKISDAALAQELQSLSAHAGTVFVGQITAMRRVAGVEEICFRVEQPVRGVAGSTFVLREWAGLWPAGTSRYSVGQRALAFLYGAGAAGMSSPVHGQEGLVPVAVQGADAPALLDIRRLAASVQRTPGTPLPTEEDGAVPLSTVLQMLAHPGALQTADLGRGPLPEARARAAAPRALRHTPGRVAPPAQRAVQTPQGGSYGAR